MTRPGHSPKARSNVGFTGYKSSPKHYCTWVSLIPVSGFTVWLSYPCDVQKSDRNPGAGPQWAPCWVGWAQDELGGWFYCHPDSAASYPPNGFWSTDGYTGRDADPAPVVGVYESDSQLVMYMGWLRALGACRNEVVIIRFTKHWAPFNFVQMNEGLRTMVMFLLLLVISHIYVYWEDLLCIDPIHMESLMIICICFFSMRVYAFGCLTIFNTSGRIIIAQYCWRYPSCLACPRLQYLRNQVTISWLTPNH